MNTIDAYHFGEIVINGHKFSSDVIIFPDRIQGNWWRHSSHELALEDITDIIAEDPEVLLVGTGATGLLEVLTETQEAVASHGIELIVQPTAEACEIYNRLSPTHRVVAALHLTC